MYASFRYAVRKAAVVKSTWLILIISVGLMIGLAGILPFNISFREFYIADEVSRRMVSIFISYSTGVATILTMVIAVFAGFKGASLFKDEIEDGSLLIMLSKPITRSTLIFSKWLAYIAVLIVFCFLVSLSHALGIGIGAKFQVDGTAIAKGLFIELAFGIVFSLIFAGIALFFSTLLNATQTAVTVLVFGVLSPLTSVIQPVTATIEYTMLRDATKDPKASLMSFVGYRYTDKNTNDVRAENQEQMLRRIGTDAVQLLIQNPDAGNLAKRTALHDFLKLLEEHGFIMDVPAKVDDLNLQYVAKIEGLFVSAPSQSFSSIDTNYLRLAKFMFDNLSIKSPDANAYLPLRIIDFNGHAATLSRYVTDELFSDDQRANLAFLTNGRISQQTLRVIPDVTVTAPLFIRAYDDLTTFSPSSEPSIQVSAERSRDEINDLFNRNGGTLYTITFGQYIAKDTVLISYVLIAIAVTPVALIILRYKNIR